MLPLYMFSSVQVQVGERLCAEQPPQLERVGEKLVFSPRYRLDHDDEHQSLSLNFSISQLSLLQSNHCSTRTPAELIL